MKLVSKRFSTQNNRKEFEAEVYQREMNLIITHTSLKQMCFSGLSDDERPKIRYDIVDLSRLPGIPPMFAVKCIMETKSTYIEQVGEMTCMSWEVSNPVTRENPLAICMNRAFDKAFILFMEFKIPVKGITGIYSSEEIPIDSKSILLKDFGVEEEIRQTVPQLVQPNLQVNPQIQENQAVSQKFPWNNGLKPQNRSEVVPNAIPQNEYSQIRVRRVSWESAFRKSKIETDKGIFIYDPQSGVWESQSMDMQAVDTRLLYSEASKWLRFDLCNFRGSN